MKRRKTFKDFAIPDEILLQYFDYVNGPTFYLAIKRVCKAFYILSNKEFLIKRKCDGCFEKKYKKFKDLTTPAKMRYIESLKRIPGLAYINKMQKISEIKKYLRNIVSSKLNELEGKYYCKECSDLCRFCKKTVLKKPFNSRNQKVNTSCFKCCRLLCDNCIEFFKDSRYCKKCINFVKIEQNIGPVQTDYNNVYFS